MLGQVVDTVVRFFSKLHCNIKCCSNTVRVSSPKRRPYKPRSPVRRQRTVLDYMVLCLLTGDLGL